MTLSVRDVAVLIKGAGYPELPSGCAFYCTGDGKEQMVLVPYPGEIFPYIFYIREDHLGKCEAFRAIRPEDLRGDKCLDAPQKVPEK